MSSLNFLTKYFLTGIAEDDLPLFQQAFISRNQLSALIPQALHDRMRTFWKHGTFGFGASEDGKSASDQARKILNTHFERIMFFGLGFTIHELSKTLNGPMLHDKLDLEVRLQLTEA